MREQNKKKRRKEERQQTSGTKRGAGIQGSDTNLEWKRRFWAATQGFSLMRELKKETEKDRKKEKKEGSPKMGARMCEARHRA